MPIGERIRTGGICDVCGKQTDKPIYALDCAPLAGGAICEDCKLESEQAELEADPDYGICDRCGGEGFIEYNDGDGSDWGEDSPSEENHLITCRQCHGTGKS